VLQFAFEAVARALKWCSTVIGWKPTMEGQMMAATNGKKEGKKAQALVIALFKGKREQIKQTYDVMSW
jgi:hypothetical protein